MLSTTEEVCGQFGLTVFSRTPPALGDCVFPAVEEEQGTLFRTQNLRLSAIEVGNTISHENDGIVFRDRLGARRAGPLLLHAATSNDGTVSLRLCGIQRLPRRPLSCVARRAFPRGAGRARWRVFHPGRVEGCSPDALVSLPAYTSFAASVITHPPSTPPGSIWPTSSPTSRSISALSFAFMISRTTPCFFRSSARLVSS